MEYPSNFEHFQKESKIVIANVFPKLTTVQALVTPLAIQRYSKHPSTVNMLNGPKR